MSRKAQPIVKALVLFGLHHLNAKLVRTYIYVVNVACSVRPTLKIFLFPLHRPCFTGMGRSVGFFLTYQIGYPLNLIVYSKTCLKRPLKKIQKMFDFSRPIIA